MPSRALDALVNGIAEVRDLQIANPTPPGGFPDRPRVIRALNRASVVLLCSHFERYLRNVNEEAATFVNGHKIPARGLPERLRLEQSRRPIDELAKIEWPNRAQRLVHFVKEDGGLWMAEGVAQLDHERLIRWMKSPSPRSVGRLCTLWGVENIFERITRRPSTKRHMWLKLGELVDKRNAIAHGDADAEATAGDITGYVGVVRDVSHRADGVLSRTVGGYCGAKLAW